MHDQVVTIFNRFDAQDDTLYYASVIENVNLRVDKKAAISKSGLKDADAMWCSIRYYKDSNGIEIDGKKHLSPIEWKRQVSDEREQSLTFAEGLDILLDGAWDGPAVISDSDYRAIGFLSWLRKNYDGVYLINSAARYDVIPHFELGGN